MGYDHTKDNYGGSVSREAPANRTIAVTPSDDDELAVYAKSLYIFVPSGTTDPAIAVFAVGDHVDSNGATVFPLPEGATILPVRVRQVMETGTSEDITIIALYD